MKHFLMILFLVSPVVNYHFDELTKEYFSNMYFLDIFPVDKLCCVGSLMIGAMLIVRSRGVLEPSRQIV